MKARSRSGLALTLRSSPERYWSEVYGSLDEVIAVVLLTTQPRSLVTIVEGDPDDPNRTFLVLVPEWGSA